MGLGAACVSLAGRAVWLQRPVLSPEGCSLKATRPTQYSTPWTVASFHCGGGGQNQKRICGDCVGVLRDFW